MTIYWISKKSLTYYHKRKHNKYKICKQEVELVKFHEFEYHNNASFLLLWLNDLTAFHWNFWLKLLFLLTHIYTNIYSRNSWKINSDTPRHTSIPVKGCHYELWMTLGFLASGEKEFDLGPLTRLDHLELLCNQLLLKYKRYRESFWHRHQQGAERVPPLLVFSKKLYTYWKVKVKLLSRVQLFATPWTVAYQASPSIRFSY